MNILEIAKTKPHNLHYLNRYLKFIEYCRTNIKDSTYLENHHILPKAKDLFPEYKDFKIFSWNRINLTAREHIMAHVLLWKVYGGSQMDALHYMLNVHCTRVVPAAISINYAAKLKEIHYINRLGKATYKDSIGNKYFLHKEDFLIGELNLVGNNLGHKHSEEAKLKQSIAKNKYRKIKLYFLDNVKTISVYSDELVGLLNQGWSTIKTKDDYEYILGIGRKKVSDKLKGRATYYPNGQLYGKIEVNSPLIDELGLIKIFTESNKQQWKNRSELAKMANTGTTIYNNGAEERKFKTAPVDSQWKIGRLERSEEYSNKFKDAVLKANSNKVYWNNGVICKKLPKGINPGSDWKMGMLKRSKH